MSNLDKNYDFLYTKISQFIAFSKKKIALKQLQNEDISPFVTQSACSDLYIKKLERYISQNQKYFKATNFKLIRIYFYLLGQSHIVRFLVRLIGDGMTASGIFILDLITEELKTYNSQNPKQVSYIIFLMLGLVLNFTIRNQFTCLSDWQSSKQHAQIQSTLQYLIYKKSLLVLDFSQNQASEEEEEEEENDQKSDEQNLEAKCEEIPNINNLLTSDTEDQAEMFERFSALGVNLLMLITAAYLIYQRIGSSIFGQSSVFVLVICFNLLVNKFSKVCFQKMYSARDKRISLSKDVIEGIKSIKLLGWEQVFLKKINQVREKEFKYFQLAKICEQSLDVMFSSFTCFLSYTFITNFVNNGNQLQDSNVFTIIAILSYFNYTLTSIPELIYLIIKSFVSFRRIQNYLNMKEIEKNYFIDDENKKSKIDDKTAILIQDMKFLWPSRSLQRKINNKILNKDGHKQIKDQNQFQLVVNNLEIKKGSLNFVIGKIGSGKTAFLLSVMGEMEQNQEEIDQKDLNKQFFVNGSLAYIGQNHWLQSETIRENILFGERFNKELYDKCLELCELKEDLESFSKGDLKELSSQASNLSGGQKQRIALCRGLYADKDIYILDDIFSSLDGHVAEKIFQNVIINYLVQEKKKTVILTTSHYSFLQTQYQSNIIYFENGAIINNKNSLKKYFDESFKKQNEEYSELQELKSNITHDKENHKASHKIKNKNGSQVQTEVELTKQDDLKSFSEEQNLLISESDEEKDAQEEQNEQGRIKFQTYLEFFSTMTLFLVLIQVLLFAMTQSTYTLIDYWLKYQISPNEDQSSILILINQHFKEFKSGFLFLTTLQLVIALFSYFTFIVTSSLSSKRIYNKLIASIINSKMIFFDQNPIGRILRRVSDDTNSIDESLQNKFKYCLEQIAYIVGYTLGICIQYPWMILPFVAVFILAAVFSNIYRPVSREVTRINTINQDILLHHINQSCKGFSTIRAFNKQAFMIDQYLKKLRNNVNSFIMNQSLHSWVYSRSLFLADAIKLVIAFAGISLLIMNPSINKDIIILTLQYSILFSSSIAETTDAFNKFELEIISFERVRQFFSNDLEKINEKPKQQIKEAYQSENPFELSFRDVSLSYDAQSSIEEEDLIERNIQYALKNFTLEIKKGERIAFCGRTGSGKTSIFNCLYRLYEIQNGNIFMQGQDVKNLSLKQLRDKISIIPQFGFLFNASLRQNLDPEEIFSSKQIIETAKKYQLSLDASIQTPLNLDFEIDESGKNLSNGQKQILNFLRVALNNKDLICLDEATSNMDPKTNSLISDKIFELSEGKTLLVITHRLENIEKYDRIIVMDQGRIVESGTYQQLIQTKEGFFNKLKQCNNQ